MTAKRQTGADWDSTRGFALVNGASRATHSAPKEGLPGNGGIPPFPLLPTRSTMLRCTRVRDCERGQLEPDLVETALPNCNAGGVAPGAGGSVSFDSGSGESR
jgi:hypothetical protein